MAAEQASAGEDGDLREDETALSCAICLEELCNDVALARLPCCTIPATATTQFCQRCIEIVCEHGPDGVGRCPNCRAYLRIHEDGSLYVAQRTEMCSLCMQTRVIVEERGQFRLCDACLLGTQFTLRYECERCRRFQRIPHPMWRYQPTPNDFGNTSWFCHVACHEQTHWRVHEQDVPRVPVHDCPESWGRRDEWFHTIREQRRREMHSRGNRQATPTQRRARSREATLLLFVGVTLLVSVFELSSIPLGLRWAGAVGVMLWSACS
mmetsp:Transcript_2193/g.6909  ORF Transcript_2193/g.6909 Transcript_2193/m.6909 type:complete len:266 (+) Transcript_2193:185-982(+)